MATRRFAPARASRLWALVAACALAAAAPAHAALGDTDPSYGSGGLAVSPAPVSPVDAHLDATGGAVLAGWDTSGDGADAPRIVRLDADGAHDLSWGEGGVISLPPAVYSFVIEPTPGGQWLVASLDSESGLAFTRLTADGDILETRRVGDEPSTGEVADMKVLGDGRVFMVGNAPGGHQFLLKFGADLTYEGGSSGAGVGPARVIALDVAGRVLVGGAGAGGGYVMRFGPTLGRDGNFGDGGTVRLGTDVRDVRPTADGGMLVAGSAGTGALLARLTSSGAVDDSFGSTYFPGGRSAVFEDLVVDPVGGIFAAGTSAGDRMLLYRFDDRGLPDTMLRPHGFREIEAQGGGIAVALDAQERPHVLGSSQGRPAAARLLPNAAPVAAIAGPDHVPVNGRAIFDASGSADPERALRRFEWDLDGDGGFETDSGVDPGAAHTFTAAGDHTVSVRVTDHRGLQDIARHRLRVGPPPGPVPVLGQAFVAEPVRGRVLVRQPGESRYSALRAPRQIPQGTLVDARVGRVRIIAARDASGATDRAVFYRGRFRVSQTRGAAPYTTLALYGGNFRGCGATRPRLRAPIAETAAKRSRRRVVRRLWGKGHGRFRTKGRYASATVHGTKWQTIDRCDGVKLQVVRGVVEFRDLLRATRARRVRAGHTDFVPSKRNP